MNNENGKAILEAKELEKKKEDVKECNYTLVNSITSVEAILKEKELLEKELNATGTIKDGNRIKKLQYNIALQTEILMKTLMKLDSISITGHIKHTHRIKREKRREKQQQFDDEMDLNTSTESRSRSESNSTSNTSSSNFSSDSGESDTDSGESSESDSEEYIPKFSPHKLRKFRKQLVNRIMRLIDYVDLLSNETKEIKKRYEQSKLNSTTTTTSTAKSNTNNYHQQPPGHHQHKNNENKQAPTIGQNRSPFNSNSRNNNNNNNNNNFTNRQHTRQSSYDFDSPFEFKEFNNSLNDDLLPFGEEEENHFDADNFESPSSTLNRYRSNSNRESNLPRLFRR